MSQLAARLEKTEVQLETDLSKSATLPPGASLSAAMASDAGHKTHTLRRPKKEDISDQVASALSNQQPCGIQGASNQDLAGAQAVKPPRYVNISDEQLATLRRPKPMVPASDSKQQTLRLTHRKTEPESGVEGHAQDEQVSQVAHSEEDLRRDYISLDDMVDFEVRCSSLILFTFLYCICSQTETVQLKPYAPSSFLLWLNAHLPGIHLPTASEDEHAELGLPTIGAHWDIDAAEEPIAADDEVAETKPPKPPAYHYDSSSMGGSDEDDFEEDTYVTIEPMTLDTTELYESVSVPAEPQDKSAEPFSATATSELPVNPLQDILEEERAAGLGSFGTKAALLEAQLRDKKLRPVHKEPSADAESIESKITAAAEPVPSSQDALDDAQADSFGAKAALVDAQLRAKLPHVDQVASLSRVTTATKPSTDADAKAMEAKRKQWSMKHLSREGDIPKDLHFDLDKFNAALAEVQREEAQEAGLNTGADVQPPAASSQAFYDKVREEVLKQTNNVQSSYATERLLQKMQQGAASNQVSQDARTATLRKPVAVDSKESTLKKAEMMKQWSMRHLSRPDPTAKVAAFDLASFEKALHEVLVEENRDVTVFGFQHAASGNEVCHVVICFGDDFRMCASRKASRHVDVKS